MDDLEREGRKGKLLKDICDALNLQKAAESTVYSRGIKNKLLMPRLLRCFVDTGFLDDCFDRCDFEKGMAESGTLIFRGDTCLFDAGQHGICFHPEAKIKYHIYKDKLDTLINYILFEKPVLKEFHERIAKYDFHPVTDDGTCFILPPPPTILCFGDAYKKFIANEAYDGGKSLPK
jgi:hypothetical protein